MTMSIPWRSHTPWRNGATWTMINIWTISGTQTIDHIHAVRWDQFREAWWIVFGDDPDLLT